MEEVVPYVGTWIEIFGIRNVMSCAIVVPYVGTWIEMKEEVDDEEMWHSRSLRGNVDRNWAEHPGIWICIEVVPYVGTWIEIL